MIGRIRGVLVEKSMTAVLVESAGVGYEIDIPLTTFYRLPDSGQEVILHTHLVVREDAQLLYGFYTIGERDMFRSLIKVNSVGPRLALNILSGVESDALIRCIREQDEKTLVGLPGVGRKTATRLIMEMRDRLPDIEASGETYAEDGSRDIMADAEAALIGLGFKPQEASRALARVEAPASDVETLIKHALKALS
ncbi:MAG TPA: Holliday junction branch migration protein RuvA [Alphaproteobacteria bacterium]|nr:Holliday junction branch migration protein RuvA [Alphaproteobacteria bacterium]